MALAGQHSMLIVTFSRTKSFFYFPSHKFLALSTSRFTGSVCKDTFILFLSFSLSSIIRIALNSYYGTYFIAKIKALQIFLNRDFILCVRCFLPPLLEFCKIRYNIFPAHSYRMINFPILFPLVAGFASTACTQWDFLVK